MKSLLPVILVILLLTGAITFALSKRVIPKREENRFGIAANELKGSSTDNSDSDATKKNIINFVTPTPSAKAIPTPTATPKVTPTPTVSTVSEVAEISVTEDQGSTTKGGVTTIAPKTTKTVTTTTKTVVCTPVYGQANTCTEHIVVDTGAADAIFFNFAGISYLTGLASFVFAKRS